MNQAVDIAGNLPALTQHFASASASMLAAILDQSTDCIKVLGPAGQLDYMNRNGRCAMEIEDFDAVAGRDWWELWPEASQGLVRDAVARAQAGESHRFEAFCPTAKGSPRWWEVSVSPLRDDSGELQGIISVSRDITDRVATRDLRETAAAEMRHRLQNAYTLAGAIVSATAKGSPERELFATEVLGRLQQLGAAQTLLLEGGQVHLDTLLHRLTEPFAGQDCELRIDPTPSLILNEDDVRVLALAVGELSTNSNKYGALRHGGAILVETSVTADGNLCLHWAERSAGLHQQPATTSGKGHKLIERALRSRGGSLDLDWRPDGPDATLLLPLPR